MDGFLLEWLLAVLGPTAAFIGCLWLILACLIYVTSAEEIACLKNLAAKLDRPNRRFTRSLKQGLPNWIVPAARPPGPRPMRRWWWWMTDWAFILHPGSEAERNRLIAQPWSWPVLVLALRLALIYPMALATAQSAVSGGTLEIEGVALFPITEADGVVGFFALIVLVITMTAIAAQIAVAGLAISAVGSIGVVAAAGAGAIAGAGAGAIAGAIAAGVAVMAAIGHQTRKGRGLAVHLVVILGVLVLGSALLVAFDFSGASSLFLLLFFLFLPALNALFDWLSYGTTIYLLRQGYGDVAARSRAQSRWIWPFVYGVLDLIAAFVILSALGACLVLALSGINAARGDTLLDLVAILTAPTEHLWILAMVASTLVPTLVHLAVAGLSLLSWLPARIWHWMFAGLDKGGARQPLASAALAAAVLATGLLSALGLGGGLLVLWLFGGLALDGIAQGLLILAQALA